MEAGVVLLPEGEWQAAIQQGLPWLYPRLQAEFPGDPDSLSPLHFGEIEKVWRQGFKNGQIISCIGFSEGRLYVFLCGGFLLPWRSYRGQNQHFYKRKRERGFSVCPRAALLFYENIIIYISDIDFFASLCYNITI